MAVDTAQYLGALNLLLPADSDDIAEGDNQIRAFKTAAKQSFPNVTGEVTPTHTELNYVDGVTSAIQTQLDAKAPTASPAFTGTPTVPTAALSTSTTQAASTAFVMAAIASVNAQTALVLTNSNSAAVTIVAGQQDASTYAGVVTWTLPAVATAGDRCKTIVANGRTDNVVNFNGLKHEGLSDATMTLNSAYAKPEFTYISTAYGWSVG